MSNHEGAPVIGIDLGTTNSSVAVVEEGVPRLIPVDGQLLLPSVVGLGEENALLVGRDAANMLLLYPHRTIRSVKRRMGEEVELTLGDRKVTPVEVSAMILRTLADAASDHLGREVRRAVITVPAYFTDSQRTATKEAGEVAGLEVERILNEPTAAALCYGADEEEERTVMVYDLGGGTFDVSIVRTGGDITEVLASHGNTALGGDDFDAALLDRLRTELEQRHTITLEGKLRAQARLMGAAEAAKIGLSSDSFVQITEEHLLQKGDEAIHLDREVSRHELEELIRPMVERTKDSVQTALSEAGILARDLDELILVGGSTRTPMIGEMLRSLLDLPPRMDVDPDAAVALGAALQGARIAGDNESRILVDVTPFTFGTSYVGVLDGQLQDDCYSGIIKRNTPLPTRQTQVFYTMADGQEQVDVKLFQGESQQAEDNLLIGRFMVDGLDPDARSGSPILFDLKLDLDGILQVEVVEKHTGLKKALVIEDAFRKLSPAELEAARKRIREIWGEKTREAFMAARQAEAMADGAPEGDGQRPGARATPEGLSEAERTLWLKAVGLVDKAQRMAPDLAATDRGEVEEVASVLAAALEQPGEMERISELAEELADILFYLE